MRKLFIAKTVSNSFQVLELVCSDSRSSSSIIQNDSRRFLNKNAFIVFLAIGKDIELDAVGRQFETYLTAVCVCMLVE